MYHIESEGKNIILAYIVQQFTFSNKYISPNVNKLKTASSHIDNRTIGIGQYRFHCIFFWKIVIKLYWNHPQEI